MVDLVYKFNEKSTASVEKVSRPLKCHSNFLGGHTYTYTFTYIHINGHQPQPPARAYARGGNDQRGAK